MTQSIRVATYNIRKAVGLDQRRDPARIIAVLREIDADIIALQEADRRFGARASVLPVAQLEAETPWVAVPLDFRPAAIGWHGNAILVRRDRVKLHHANPIELPTLEPRGAVEAELEVGGRLLRVIGVHLDLSGLWRRRQLKTIFSHIELSPRHMPTVMMGDFNQWSDRGALGELAYHHHKLVNTPRSFHSARPVARLDRIIVSHDIQIEDNGAHISALSRQASDHLPVWAQLRIK